MAENWGESKGGFGCGESGENGELAKRFGCHFSVLLAMDHSISAATAAAANWNGCSIHLFNRRLGLEPRLDAQSRRAALIRVCQPGPAFLKADNTSRSIQMVVESFVSLALGRPRLTGAAANFAFHAGVERSGASSGSDQTGFVDFLFARIGFSHAYDAACLAARGPN